MKQGDRVSIKIIFSNKRIASILVEQTRLRRWLRSVWLIAIVVVAIGSLLPGDSAPIRALSDLRLGDKVQHFVAYAFLAFLPAIHERLRMTAAATVAIFALGIGLEVCQLYTGWRAFEIADIVADTAGVCCGLAIGYPMQPVIRSSLVGLRPTQK